MGKSYDCGCIGGVGEIYWMIQSSPSFSGENNPQRDAIDYPLYTPSLSHTLTPVRGWFVELLLTAKISFKWKKADYKKDFGKRFKGRKQKGVEGQHAQTRGRSLQAEVANGNSAN